jgi:hypothetical protein
MVAAELAISKPTAMKVKAAAFAVSVQSQAWLPYGGIVRK